MPQHPPDDPVVRDLRICDVVAELIYSASLRLSVVVYPQHFVLPCGFVDLCCAAGLACKKSSATFGGLHLHIYQPMCVNMSGGGSVAHLHQVVHPPVSAISEVKAQACEKASFRF